MGEMQKIIDYSSVDRDALEQIRKAHLYNKRERLAKNALSSKGKWPDNILGLMLSRDRTWANVMNYPDMQVEGNQIAGIIKAIQIADKENGEKVIDYFKNNQSLHGVAIKYCIHENEFKRIAFSIVDKLCEYKYYRYIVFGQDVCDAVEDIYRSKKDNKYILKNNDISKCNIEAWDFSARTINLLHRHGIFKCSELLSTNIVDIKKWKGAGVLTQAEILFFQEFNRIHKEYKDCNIRGIENE